MSDITLSIIIPCYHDPYVVKTIEDILKNSGLGDKLEIIPVFDGFVPDFKLIEDPRVKYIYLGANRGMRGAINAGVAVARGKFIGRADEHQKFGENFDLILTSQCKENEMMTCQRWYLNPETWEVMLDKGSVDAEKLVIQEVAPGVRKFTGKIWKEKAKEMKGTPIFEVSALQGSWWIANREFFLKTVGELSTAGYGPLIQDSVEVSMKYWQAGGRLLMNHNTWHAHKHRSFSRTHNNGSPENPSKDSEGYAYSLSQWETYYNEVIKPRFGI